jgi:hypothetical protein
LAKSLCPYSLGSCAQTEKKQKKLKILPFLKIYFVLNYLLCRKPQSTQSVWTYQG